MTLIAFNAQPDAVEFLTDGFRYSRRLESVALSDKCRAFPHLGLVIATQGPCAFGTCWTNHVETGEAGTDIDDINRTAPMLLSELWNALGDDDSSAVVIHAGYSTARDEHIVYRYRSLSGFASDDLSGCFYIIPAPETLTPQPPTSDAEWIALAEAMRQDVAMLPPGEGKVLIGGSVIHTRIQRDQVTQRRIHRFNDTGDEWQRLVGGSLHPDAIADTLRNAGIGRNDPCICGSGTKAKHCCGRRAPSRFSTHDHRDPR